MFKGTQKTRRDSSVTSERGREKRAFSAKKRAVRKMTELLPHSLCKQGEG